MKFQSILRIVVNAYIIAIPLTVVMMFLYFAVHSGGVFTIDMTTKDEYLLEVGMLVTWFLLVSIKSKSLFNSIIHTY